MSRNIDKSNSTLAKLQEFKAGEAGYKDYSRYKRPTKPNYVKSLFEAQQWRNQLLNEFKNKNTRIFDPSLNELQVRELNDDLNDLIQEKKRWDWHIKTNLNGPDDRRNANNKLFVGGKIVLGKRYFGRAKELPEIQTQLKNAETLKKSRVNNLVDVRCIPNRPREKMNKKGSASTEAKLYYHSYDVDGLSKYEHDTTQQLRTS